MNAKTLCAAYAPYRPLKRLEKLFDEFDRVLVTSSFGTSSAILLHHLHQVKPDHPVHFIDTGYLFPETLAYQQSLIEKWGLNIIHVRPKANEHAFTKVDYTWSYQPDSCCFVNKVMPMDELKADYQVWISGMVRGTSETRQSLPLFKQDGNLLRFYPLADMEIEEAQYYNFFHEIPEHPLQSKGYASVGCQHCTLPGKGRDGRWAGKVKTECGLHRFAS